MGLRDRLTRLSRRIGMGVVWAGATVRDLTEFGFLGERAGRRAEAPAGTQRLALAAGLVCAVARLERAARWASEPNVRPDELARADAEAAEARALLGLAEGASDAEVESAVLAIGRREGFHPRELDSVRSMVRRQFELRRELVPADETDET